MMGSSAEMLCLERGGWRLDVYAGAVEQRRGWIAQGSGEP